MLWPGVNTEQSTSRQSYFLFISFGDNPYTIKLLV